MGQFPYICEQCGGGDVRCCTTHEESEDSPCEGGQTCWSENAVCVIDAFTMSNIMIHNSVDFHKMTAAEWMHYNDWIDYCTKDTFDTSKAIFDKWKGIPLKMTYNAEGAFTCDKIPDIKFQVDAEGCEVNIPGIDGISRAYPGIHVKAWCENCWDK